MDLPYGSTWNSHQKGKKNVEKLVTTTYKKYN